MKKSAYLSPQVEVIELEIEASILAASSVTPGFDDGGDAW